jgi:hypothetical protein
MNDTPAMDNGSVGKRLADERQDFGFDVGVKKSKKSNFEGFL